MTKSKSKAAAAPPAFQAPAPNNRETFQKFRERAERTSDVVALESIELIDEIQRDVWGLYDAEFAERGKESAEKLAESTLQVSEERAHTQFHGSAMDEVRNAAAKMGEIVGKYNRHKADMDDVRLWILELSSMSDKEILAEIETAGQVAFINPTGGWVLNSATIRGKAHAALGEARKRGFNEAADKAKAELLKRRYKEPWIADPAYLRLEKRITHFSKIAENLYVPVEPGISSSDLRVFIEIGPSPLPDPPEPWDPKKRGADSGT